jgi:hypothetical protein
METNKGKNKFDHEKADKMHKLVAFLNGIAFLTIVLMDWEKLSPLVITGFIIGSLGNFVTLVIWQKVKKFILPILYIIDSLLYCTKGYKFYLAGSQHAYLFYYFVGFGYVVTAVLSYIFRNKISH